MTLKEALLNLNNRLTVLENDIGQNTINHPLYSMTDGTVALSLLNKDTCPYFVLMSEENPEQIVFDVHTALTQTEWRLVDCFSKEGKKGMKLMNNSDCLWTCNF